MKVTSRCGSSRSVSSCPGEREDNRHVTRVHRPCPDLPAWSGWSSDLLQSTKFLIATERKMNFTFFFYLVSQHPTVSNLIASSALCGGAQRVRVTLNGFFMSNPRLRSEHFSQFGRSRGSQRTVSFADNSGCFWRKSGQQWAGISHVGGRVIYSWENSFVVGGRTCRPHLKKTVCIAHVQTLISSRCKLLQFWLKNESLTSLFFVSGINSSIIWSKKRFHLSVFSFILGSIRFQLNQCK